MRRRCGWLADAPSAGLTAAAADAARRLGELPLTQQQQATLITTRDDTLQTLLQSPEHKRMPWLAGLGLDQHVALFVAQPALRGETQRAGLEQVALAGLEVVVADHQGAANGVGFAEQAEVAPCHFEFVARLEFMGARRDLEITAVGGAFAVQLVGHEDVAGLRGHVDPGHVRIDRWQW